MAEWDTTTEDGCAVLEAPTRLTMLSAARLKQMVAAAVEGGTPHVVVDLTGTEFVDSSGLGALVGGLKSARQAGGDLRLAGAGEQVRAVLTLTNLDRVLRVHPSVSAARSGW